MNFTKAIKLTLLTGSLAAALLTQPLFADADASRSHDGGGDIVVVDRVDTVVIKPTTPVAPVADDVVVDGRIITAEDWATAPAAPASSHAFSGRLLTAADLRAEQ